MNMIFFSKFQVYVWLKCASEFYVVQKKNKELISRNDTKRKWPPPYWVLKKSLWENGIKTNGIEFENRIIIYRYFILKSF